ncbi:tRNA(Ser) Um(44) 2'-O-methyltransferase [Agyrium rufum]|nr:tRNA(Ser) Um(44) 2'-O-methyltransferase [Agyrium rufum]
MPFTPRDISSSVSKSHIYFANTSNDWLHILDHDCDFDSSIFDSVALNLIQNPNINSTHLFRADILYDSHQNEFTNIQSSPEVVSQLLRAVGSPLSQFPDFRLTRTIIRRMIPRNPQLDKPIAQSCFLFEQEDKKDAEKRLVIYVPHAQSVEELPWYHPGIRALAYLHTWIARPPSMNSTADSGIAMDNDTSQGAISIHYQLYPTQTSPLPTRVLRTAHHLLSALYRHGQGRLAGYTKRVHHDQVISQQRLQNTYTLLKQKFAKPLCEKWVEQTEPSKHVFEDLSIAAFLLELWRDMYQRPKDIDFLNLERNGQPSILPQFPGFVDVGCGNGVLVDVLLQCGYWGWGFDARRRKTWSILSPAAQRNLKEMILVPQPLCENHSSSKRSPTNVLSRIAKSLASLRSSYEGPGFLNPKWHDGVFPQGTFIISNHADELTAWTPLLAALSRSPFLIIPCCSHNLSGERFRAPSVFNSRTADNLAPSFFADDVKSSKSIPITVDTNPEFEESGEEEGEATQPKSSICAHQFAVESGDLKKLSPQARSKQPSAYSSLCDWVCHLCSSVGYNVEKEMLRIPSTRNVGIIGRTWIGDGDHSAYSLEAAHNARTARVGEIVRLEGASSRLWLDRCGLLQNAGTGKRRVASEVHCE